ncbi:MAG: ParB N-terminal domain-containing protein [Aphanocapsa sp. GSE-SYN-MK-11-07L]|jgi:hypothetical protein|nr:ParB N-terminal domain-containing protein [Aphanocapsa sp. GSE-SYN-MK-11-07L]
MTRRKPSISLDRFNERASLAYVPDSNGVDQITTASFMTLGDIGNRVGGDARPTNQKHVSALAESILVLGLISPLTVDRHGRLLAGEHRRSALSKISTEQPNRFSELFPLGIPVRVMEIDASVDNVDALLIEVEENTQRKNFTPYEIREAAKRLENAGYERLRGRPRAGQKSLKRELANVFRLSEDRIQKILNQPDEKGRRTPTFSPESAITTIEGWLKAIEINSDDRLEKAKRQMQTLAKELSRL